jgi:hypothetical protein
MMLNRLLDGFVGKLTSSKWTKIANCSQDTALRDIDSLLRRGVLVREAAGGRSTSYVLATPARCHEVLPWIGQLGSGHANPSGSPLSDLGKPG